MSRPLARCAALAAIAALLASSAFAQPRVTLLARAEIAPPAGAPGRDFGGLSGIDYDPALNRYVVISDDTAEHAPSRFYEARIDLRRARMTITATRTLRNENGGAFAVKNSGGEQADGEAIRVDPISGDRLWASEGDINAGFAATLRWAARDGAFKGRLPLPRGLTAGVRHNLAYEGVSFTPGGDLWVALEAPTAQDGPLATPQAGALIRITRLSRAGAVQRQVAYPVDPIPEAAPGKNADNGVSEILRLDDDRLLVLERSGVQVDGATYRFHCRLYLADLTMADDVTAVPRLAGAGVVPAAKTLLIDFDATPGAKVGNVEGMAWAPRGWRDRKHLVFVTDNNFDPKSASELLVFRFRPGR